MSLPTLFWENNYLSYLMLNPGCPLEVALQKHFWISNLFEKNCQRKTYFIALFFIETKNQGLRLGWSKVSHFFSKPRRNPGTFDLRSQFCQMLVENLKFLAKCEFDAVSLSQTVQPSISRHDLIKKVACSESWSRNIILLHFTNIQPTSDSSQVFWKINSPKATKWQKVQTKNPSVT